MATSEALSLTVCKLNPVNTDAGWVMPVLTKIWLYGSWMLFILSGLIIYRAINIFIFLKKGVVKKAPFLLFIR